MNAPTCCRGRLIEMGQGRSCACCTRASRAALGVRPGLVARALRLLRLLPVSFELAYLLWARKEMGPLHRDLPEVVRRINELEALRA